MRRDGLLPIAPLSCPGRMQHERSEVMRLADPGPLAQSQYRDGPGSAAHRSAALRAALRPGHVRERGCLRQQTRLVGLRRIDLSFAPWPTSPPLRASSPRSRAPTRTRAGGSSRATRSPSSSCSALWEIVARAGVFPPKLFPSLVTVAETFVNLTASGILPHHVFDTVLRLLAGFCARRDRRRHARHPDGPLAADRGHLRCRWSASARRSRASPMRRCFCCGSGSATNRRCCWSPSSRRSRSSSTPGPA